MDAVSAFGDGENPWYVHVGKSPWGVRGWEFVFLVFCFSCQCVAPTRSGFFRAGSLSLTYRSASILYPSKLVS